ncbi:SRPBCC domain-containing protein, partial [Leptospira santarosai]|uniref:SRPBCC domain-containing protein n=1 Tax=Leptospira santarosai TaxID=28183 RepID=UPI0024AEDE9C
FGINGAICFQSPSGISEYFLSISQVNNYDSKVQPVLRPALIDIQKPHYIYYKHLGDGEGAEDVDFQSKIIFEKIGEGTNLTMEQIFPNKEELERVNKKYGAIEGGKQHVGNLAKYLETLK